MRCYYEVLNIERTADDAEIKSAYKKLALRWHPDKNLSNPEEAKEQFQFVQQAYEVLSDRQERAWYDNHREQILHGSNKDFEDNCLDVFQYFTTSCYTGFGDDDEGFYTVYYRVFEQIAKEDMEHMDNKVEFTTIPMFGKSESDYETIVRPFYAYWMSYSTKRSYVWLDPYDIKETRERRVIKLIEKENKKVRAKAKKERNEEVRNLVAFVRKRDKRVQANIKLLEQKAKENKQRAQELALQARRERHAETKKEVQAEWSKFDNVQDELASIEKELAEQFDDADVSEEESDLYCVACNKIFKTPKAFANHESSKKHKENVERLREEMLDDEEFETIGSDEDLEIVNFDSVKDESTLSVNGEVEDTKNEDVDQLKNLSDLNSDELEELLEDTAKSKKKKKKNKQNKSMLITSNDEHEVGLADIDTSRKSQRKKNKSPEKVVETNYVQPEEIETVENGVVGEVDGEIDTKTQKKAKRRKDKKTKSGEASADKVDLSKGDIDIEHVCVTCKNVFPSKNKLFDHLKKTGHGVYIPPEDKARLKDGGAKEKGKRSKREERRKRQDDSD